MMKIIKYYLLLAPLIAVIYGCGGSDDSNQVPAPSPVNANIYAQDTISSFSNFSTKRVDLEGRVLSALGDELKLVKVTSLSQDPSCDAIKIDGQLSFSIQSNEDLACDYSYQVQDSLARYQAQATSRVIINQASNSLYPIIAPKSILINEYESKRIDLSYTDAQGKVYSLLEDAILLGSGSIVLDTLNNTLTYIALEKGTSRILYQLREKDGVNILLGSIDIAVSTDGNRSPTTVDFTYDTKLKPGKETVIDVANYISGDEGEQLQLTFAASFNALVRPHDPLNLTNTKFSFYADTPGDYYVTYTIDDHKGGIGIGMVKVSVENFYGDIVLSPPYEDLTFSAPLTQAQADGAGINTTTKLGHDDNSTPYNIKVALMNWSTAKSYCNSTGGRLPYLWEMKILSEYGGAKDYWPGSITYWTNNIYSSLGYVTYNPTIGDTSEWFEYADKGLYVTCINGSLEYDVSLELDKSIPTFSSNPLIIYYKGLDNINKKYSGEVNWKIESDYMPITDSKVVSFGDGEFSLNTKSIIGPHTLKAELLTPPLKGKEMVVNFNIYGNNNLGFYGDNSKGERKQFYFSRGDSLFCRDGFVTHGLGLSEDNSIGGKVGDGFPKMISLEDITGLSITFGVYQHNPGEEVIASIKFSYANGDSSTCGSATKVKISDVYTLELMSDDTKKETIVDFEVYGARYLYGIGIRTRVDVEEKID
ncbi:beta-prism lectin domain-containing protein [Shewanella algae]|uniref:beta-prism lectin domain-containing protein n=1 Tax=Shewanella algae TaxID=38313 RepID=UPI0031F59B0B